MPNIKFEQWIKHGIGFNSIPRQCPSRKINLNFFYYIQTIYFLKYLSYILFSRRKKNDIASKVFTFNQRVQGLKKNSNFFLSKNKMDEKKKPLGKLNTSKSQLNNGSKITFSNNNVNSGKVDAQGGRCDGCEH